MGSALKKKNERLLALIILLSSSENPLSNLEIIEKITLYSKSNSTESNLRTFERDKADLRGIGIAIDVTEDGKYWIKAQSEVKENKGIISVNSAERAIIKSILGNKDIELKLLAHAEDIAVFTATEKALGLKELQVISNGN